MKVLRDTTLPSRMMFVMLVTTTAALLAAGAALMVYDLRTFRAERIDDLESMAKILSQANAPALQFNDRKSTLANLRLMETRPQIVATALFDADGRLFASYRGTKQSGSIIPAAPSSGIEIEGNRVRLFYPVLQDEELLGTVYLEANYSIYARVRAYLLILLAVLLLSLLVAMVVYGWLQDSITRPLLAISDVARRLVRNRDYTMRVAPAKRDDEVSALTQAFNAMLAELEKRKNDTDAALEALQRETGERREAEEALRIADRRKDEFLAMLAHELRNPLAPIATGLAILKRAGNDADVSIQAREAMERQLRQLTRLVDDLLNVTRISTGKIATRKARIDLRDVVRIAVDTGMPLIDSHRHTLDVAMPPDPVWVHGDHLRLTQVFANLLNNAAKYTPAGGRIGFDLRVEDDVAVVRVRDNGKGIPPDMLEDIFELFVQADRSLERVSSGIGVGLTLARRLVELHDGSIHAENRSDGTGAVFVVRLPLDKRELQSENAAN